MIVNLNYSMFFKAKKTPITSIIEVIGV